MPALAPGEWHCTFWKHIALTESQALRMKHELQGLVIEARVQGRKFEFAGAQADNSPDIWMLDRQCSGFEFSTFLRMRGLLVLYTPVDARSAPDCWSALELALASASDLHISMW